MKRLFFLILNLFLSLLTFAQQQSAPKFASKVQKGIISVNTYDKKGDLLKSGTAFYISQTGDALADYTIFKGASKATVIDASGKQLDVDCINGADDTYSVVRFHVNTSKSNALTIPQYIQSVGGNVYALKYEKGKISTCPQGTIESLDSINGKYAYYKLSADLGSDYVGCPLFNDNGEVIGILQSAMGRGANARSYALDTRFREELKISAIQSSAVQRALADINIDKGIPDTQEECLVYTYFKSRSASNDEYLSILNRFIAAYPKCAEAYYRRCTCLTDLQRFDEANADLDKYMSLSTDLPVANFNYAQSVYNKVQFMPKPEYDKWTYDVALEHVNKAIELETAANRNETAANLAKDKILKAQILGGMKNYDGAIDIYNELNQGATKSASFYYALSLAKEARGDSASVIIADLDSAIAMFGEPLPSEAANYVLRRGQIYKSNKQYRQAVLDYNTYAYLLNSKVTDIFYYDRSQLEMDAHMFQQALDDINSAINIAPTKPGYYIEKGGMCLRFGQTDECIEACTQSIVLNDKIADAYRIRGYAYVQKNNMDAARYDLQKAIDLGDETAKELLKTYVK